MSSNSRSTLNTPFLYVISNNGLDERALHRLNLSLASLAEQASELTIFIADYSEVSIQDSIIKPEGLNFEYHHIPLTEPFNKPFCINYAFKAFNFSASPYFFLSDIDLIYPPSFVQRFQQHAELTDVACITALTFYQQPPGDYRHDYAKVREEIDHEGRYRGGCLLISSKLFNKVHGYDEAYFGWGGEDDDFIMRASRDGVFIVDESVEFVHLYHPQASRNPSAFGRLIEARKSNVTQQLEQTWGELDSVPTQTEQVSRNLELIEPARAQYCVIEPLETGSWCLTDLKENTSVTLNQTSLDIWRYCDGERTSEQISEMIAQEYSVSSNDIDDDVNSMVEQLTAQDFLITDELRNTRPLVHVTFSDQLSANQVAFLTWTLSIEFSLLLNTERTSISDLSIVSIRPYVGLQKADNGIQLLINSTESVAKTLDNEFKRPELVLGSTLTNPLSIKQVRLPKWVAMFAWGGTIAQPNVIPAARLFTKPRAVSDTYALAIPHKIQETENAQRLITLFQDVGECLYYQDQELQQAASQSKFIYIDESGVSPGSMREALLVAMTYATVPIYHGDPMADYDLNPDRFINIRGSLNRSVEQSLLTLINDHAAHQSCIAAEKFRNLNIQRQISPSGIAKQIRKFYDQQAL